MRQYSTYLRIVLVASLIGVLIAGATWLSLGPVAFEESYCTVVAASLTAREPILHSATTCPPDARGSSFKTVAGPFHDTVFAERPFRAADTGRNGLIGALVAYVVLVLIAVPARLLRRRDPP